MKKIIILTAFTLSFCFAEAQGPGSGYPCPSALYFQYFHKVGKAKKFKLKLVLNNESQNLNGFYLSISKSDPSIHWVVVDEEKEAYFSVKGYGKNILARLDGKTDDECDAELEQYCDIISRITYDENLYIAEILKTLDCRFFPAGYAIEVGELAVDLSDCEDDDFCYTIGVNAEPLEYSFSYTGGVEGTCGWTPADGFGIQLCKKGDYVAIWPYDFDGVAEVEKPKAIASVKYFTLAGVESAEPQQGVSIKVTTYSDGSRKSEKILR